jgi:hypothetical protein
VDSFIAQSHYLKCLAALLWSVRLKWASLNALANSTAQEVRAAYLYAVVSLRIQQLDVVCETKTLDNVFVMVNCSVQFNVIKGKEYQSFYSLSNTQASY